MMKRVTISPVLDDTSDEVTDDKEFEVEKNYGKKIDKKTNNGFYLMKLKGYDESHNIWEPAGDLDCTDLIREFEAAEKEIAAKKLILQARNSKKTTSTEIVKKPRTKQTARMSTGGKVPRKQVPTKDASKASTEIVKKPRTKQTARMSTGGIAPQKQVPTKDA